VTEDREPKTPAPGAPDWPPRDPQAEREAWHALNACLRVGELALRARVRQDTGLSLPRHQALTRLYEAPGGMTMGELSRKLGVTNGNGTALIDSLLSEGWVARESAPGDRRRVLIRLTELGRSTFHAIAGGFERQLAELFAGLSLLELRLLTSLLDKLRGSVEGAPEAEPESLRRKSRLGRGATGPGLGWV
jgi:DNA-binding MarR family transcriptional regulator